MKVGKGDTKRTDERKLRQIVRELKDRLKDYLAEKFVEKIAVWIFSAIYTVYSAVKEFVRKYVGDSNGSIIPAIAHHELSILLFGFLVLLGIAAFVVAIYRLFKKKEKEKD